LRIQINKVMQQNLKFFGLGIAGGLLPAAAVGIWLYINQKPMEIFNESAFNSAPVYQTNYPISNSTGAIDFSEASERSIHSVVHVTTKVVRQQVVRDPFLEFFYGPGIGKKENYFGQGAGSGVIVSEDGYVVTNNHVIQDASEIEVTLNNNKKYSAEVIGTDPSTDLAVLKIKADNLPAITLGDSDALRVGEWVLAVGNPFNLTSTVTAGIVSAKSRNINILAQNSPNNVPIESFIQTDAAVNPGNSGGALVNTRGELVGINTAIASQTGSYAGYSFAIPINLVKKVVGDIIEFGVVQRGFLGVRISDITQDLMESKSLSSTEGVYVAEVISGSAAAAAGIQTGDVILKIGAKVVNSSAELLEEVGKARPGQKLTVTTRNKRGEIELKDVVLKNEQGTTGLVKPKSASSSGYILGARFRELSEDEKNELKITHGVVVDEIQAGKLKTLGLKEGMVITRVNNEKIYGVSDLFSRLEKKSGGILLEIVTQTGRREYIGFGL
jgi:serine protease Do